MNLPILLSLLTLPASAVVTIDYVNVGCRKPGNTPNSGHEPWFRGQNRSSHGLLPSLFRLPFADPDDADQAHIQWVESELLYEFASRARELKDSSMSDWDILFAMQHYGVPTRLLDWTEVLGVAVYFSQHPAKLVHDDHRRAGTLVRVAGSVFGIPVAYAPPAVTGRTCLMPTLHL
jgi:hypothetical protein